ncbi:MAG TPA: PAS domain-containing sensor histidine kinase [Rhizomicrobium sp.]|nr:PAS domain-containing sensor histidine kinase [Rhizomicrobium sp.]
MHFDLAERAARFGYWRVDLSSGKAYWSPGMYRLLGIDPKTYKPDSDWLLEQMLPEDKATVQAVIADAIRNRRPFAYRTRARDPRVAAQIVDTQGELEIDESGRVISVLGVCYDVTKQVRAEEAREKAQALYKIMTEEASDMICLYDKSGAVVFASHALERVLGRTAEEVAYSRFMGLVHPDDLDEAKRVAVLPARGETNTATYRVRHADGRYLWIEATTRAAYDDVTNEFRHLVVVGRDVSQRRQQELETQAARERAEAANKAKSRFLANMSHELRTPLNAVIGFTDLMRQGMFGALGNERYEEYATLIYDSGQLLLDLISDMLDMAKIEAGKLELNLEVVDLTGTVQDCVRLLAERACAAGIALGANLPAAPIAVMADRRAVKQVLLNLLSNAIKFTPAGGSVEVIVTLENERVHVQVRDTGIGIPAADLPRLGRPFEQVCADPMLAKSGTGLGLALVRALVELHGGQLRIESQEGAGTSVNADFPIARLRRSAA